MATGVTKSGQYDFGRWDIPLDFRARTFTVTVIGDNGTIGGPAITINHQGDSGPKCHHIIWQKSKIMLQSCKAAEWQSKNHPATCHSATLQLCNFSPLTLCHTKANKASTFTAAGTS